LPKNSGLASVVYDADIISRQDIVSIISNLDYQVLENGVQVLQTTLAPNIYTPITVVDPNGETPIIYPDVDNN
jgi:hypothetical protein